jgi:hypothetical protein
VPRLAVVGDVTVKWVEALVLGLSVSVEFANAACHSVGRFAWSAKLDATQLEGSLFVTETV